MGIRTGTFIVAAWGGFLGGFTFLALTDFALNSAQFCINQQEHCLREWLGALSGWAAAIAASATIAVLLSQASAARDAASIARSTLAATREATERAQRAYLLTNGVRPKGFDQSEGNWFFDLKLQNYGQTPAYKVRVSLAEGLGDASIVDFGKVELMEGYATIGPGQKLKFAVMKEAASRSAIKSRQVDYRVWGILDYEDAFGRKNSSRFCYVFLPDADSGKGIFLMPSDFKHAE